MHNSLPPSNEIQTDFNEPSPSIFTSFSTKIQNNEYFQSKPTDSLINDITKQSYKPDNQLSSSITSLENSTKDFKLNSSTVTDEEHETLKDSENNF
ncbi:hypothetical protein TNIN_300031 [Trichonephila inaurata madagascariensis]|uniref:Uncharacterized protein n=1 Tax=Trichonephila inaurata madagascariensis TaxID=2747483 RepID=A0A8X6XAY0_9ARAC|nr:hypothetical protein TNIN_300031 [Trichonephila inaurata madagascariensis]